MAFEALLKFVVEKVLRCTQALKHVTSRHFIRYCVHTPLAERCKMSPDNVSCASHFTGMGSHAAW